MGAHLRDRRGKDSTVNGSDFGSHLKDGIMILIVWSITILSVLLMHDLGALPVSLGPRHAMDEFRLHSGAFQTLVLWSLSACSWLGFSLLFL